MSDCNKNYAYDAAKQYLTYANYATTATLMIAKKIIPTVSLGDVGKALGVTSIPAALSTQAAVSFLGVSKNESTPITENISVSAPVLAMFAKIGNAVVIGATIAGATVSAPVTAIAVGLTVATVVTAMAADKTVREIINDPEFLDSIKSMNPSKVSDYFESKGVGLSDILEAAVEAAHTGTFDLKPTQIPTSDCDWHDYQNANRDGKFHWLKPDPLTLDLDGDGIETVSAKGYKGALFDHNKDGIKTATGWISADDGILVVDKNSDGIINNGDELFGDNYTLKDGKTAATGYEALAEFDTNGDKIIDAKDENFDKLRIWRDLNQDGTSQKDELFTLKELNIQSLDVAYKDVNQNLGNGNRLARDGSYTTADGKTQKMGDLLLANDNMYSKYTDSVEMTAEQAAAANLQGIGRLRDLREAAALSPDLAADLKAYSAAETKEAQKALLDGLIDKWAKTDPLYGTGIQFLPPTIETENEGVALTRGQTDAAKILIPSKEYLDMVDSTLQKIAALDAFSGLKSNTVYVTSNQDILKFYQTTVKTYNQLSENIYQGLLFQTRLKPYVEQIGFEIENNEFKLDYSGVLKAFGDVYAKNPEKAFVDLSEFLINSKSTGESVELSVLWLDYWNNAKEQGFSDAWLKAIGEDAISKLGYQTGTEKDDTLNGKGRNSILEGGEGNDTLKGSSRIHDVLVGGSGTDRLEGGSGSDIYVFTKGHGQDTVLDTNGGVSLKDVDILHFSDVDFAEASFRKEGDHLIVYGYNKNDSVKIEYFFSTSKFYGIERFKFKDKAVTLEEFQRNGLKLNGTDADDTIQGWNGKALIYAGNGNDTVTGYSADDFLNGGAGNDKLLGNKGNNTLVGGTGNDYLEGSNGNDTYVFAKGDGQDTVLDGSYFPGGNDTLRLTDIVLEEVQFRKENSDLILFGYNDGDSLQIRNYFFGNDKAYEIETFQFKNGILSNPEFGKYLNAENNMTNSMLVFSGLLIDADKSVSQQAIVG